MAERKNKIIMEQRTAIPENCKVNLLWDENDSRKFNIVRSEQGKYIIGHDPFRRITLWHRFWMFFGLYKNLRSKGVIMKYGDKGLMYIH